MFQNFYNKSSLFKGTYCNLYSRGYILFQFKLLVKTNEFWIMVRYLIIVSTGNKHQCYRFMSIIIKFVDSR